jgi:HD superfamily phosphodiesterase
MNYHFDFELSLILKVFPDLLRGREGFDLPHTKAVVHWIKEIVASEPKLDKQVLITAAYAHDWGYIDMGIGKNTTLAEVHDAKEQHMQVGAKRIADLLTDTMSDQYTPEQIQRVGHLVFVHDRLGQVTDEDEIALVEADTLGALDTDFVTPTFSKADNQRYIQEQVLALRRPLFRHNRAIEVFDDLLQKRVGFYR